MVYFGEKKGVMLRRCPPDTGTPMKQMSVFLAMFSLLAPSLHTSSHHLSRKGPNGAGDAANDKIMFLEKKKKLSCADAYALTTS